MSGKILKNMALIEASVEKLDKDKQEAAIASALYFAQGFAAGMMAQDEKKDRKGA